MLVIGVAGNLGTGKTTVSQMLVELGARHIEADEVGHELLQQDKQARRQIVAAFGKSILNTGGEIDRDKLAGLVFDDKAALTRLNRITHPRILRLVKQKIEEYHKAGAGVVVVEAALLIEAGWRSQVDQLWVTTAPEATIVARLMKSRGMSEEQILDRLRAQMPQEDKARQADVVINTDCPMEALRTRISELWKTLPA
ncbi:MAG TPA: dephospho-CoA kinase [Dehalococcoidia bacterium]|jgi:dephospho-CoA kinase